MGSPSTIETVDKQHLHVKFDLCCSFKHSELEEDSSFQKNVVLKELCSKAANCLRALPEVMKQ